MNDNNRNNMNGYQMPNNNGMNNNGFNQNDNQMNNNFNSMNNNGFNPNDNPMNNNFNGMNNNGFNPNDNQMNNNFNGMNNNGFNPNDNPMNNNFNGINNNGFDTNNPQMNNNFNGMNNNGFNPNDNQMNNNFNSMNNNGFNPNDNQMNSNFNGINNNGFNQNDNPMNSNFNGMNNNGFNPNDNQMNNNFNSMNNNGFNSNDNPMNSNLNGMNNNGFNPNNPPMNNNFNGMNNGQMNGNYYQNNKNGNTKTSIFQKYKLLFIVLAIVIVIVICVAFSKNGDDTKTVDHNRNIDYDRLIMIYMVGSDLESGLVGAGTLDLNGIDYNTLEGKNTKVIVIAGGSKNWKNNYVDINSTSIYELTSNGYKIVKSQKLLNMGDSNVFKDFLNYGYENYAANKYDLIFWNHGLGVLGGGSDELSGDFLSLQEMGNAFNKSYFKDNNKLEVMIFRTCLNGTIEVADTLKKHANYLVASEEKTWMYKGNNILKVVNSFDSKDDGKQLGIKFIDGYMSYINIMNTSFGYYTYNTYGLYDLNKLDKLEQSLSDFFNSINIQNNFIQIAKVRSVILQYAKEDDPTYDSVDIYNLINNLKSLSPDKAQKVLDAFNETVLYSKATDNNSKGLSIYFPYFGEIYMKNRIINDFYSFDGLKDYKKFITSFSNIQNSNKTPMSLAGNATKALYNSSKNETDFQLNLTDEQLSTFSKARYIVFEKEDDNNYFPVYSSNDIITEEKILKANFKDKQLKFVDKSDKTEQIITLNEEEITDDYILYNAFALLSNYSFDYTGEDLKIYQAKLILKLDRKTNKVSVVSVLIRGENSKDNDDTVGSLPYNVVVDLNDYEYITFTTTKYIVTNEDGTYSNNWKHENLDALQLKTKDIKFELEDFKKKKEYYAAFMIWDIYGNVSYSNLVKINKK